MIVTLPLTLGPETSKNRHASHGRRSPYSMPPPTAARSEPRRPLRSDAEDAYEDIVVPFPRRRTQSADRAAFTDRAGEARADRPAPRTRRGRAERKTPPSASSWLVRHAASIALLSVAVGVLGLAFGVMQIAGSGRSSVTQLPVAGQGATGLAAAPSLPSSERTASAFTGLPASAGPSAVAASALAEPRLTLRTLEANYTVVAGDSLAAIALRFDTTVPRLQALNALDNPRVLNVGQKLIIPPPLPAAG